MFDFKIEIIVRTMQYYQLQIIKKKEQNEILEKELKRNKKTVTK